MSGFFMKSLVTAYVGLIQKLGLYCKKPTTESSEHFVLLLGTEHVKHTVPSIGSRVALLTSVLTDLSD